MIKRIIFDIDNTLIMGMGSEIYIKGYQEVFESLGYLATYEKAKELYDVLDFYEEEEDIYDKNKMLNFINHKLETNYEMSLIDGINDKIANAWIHEVDSDVLDTLKYLSSKYELYALSNWFTSVQEKRLDLMKMLKYFTKVIGTDKVKIKPNAEAYKMAMGDKLPSECLFIGDRPDKDLDVPCRMGSKGIYFDYKNKKDYSYKRITNLKELKEIL